MIYGNASSAFESPSPFVLPLIELGYEVLHGVRLVVDAIEGVVGEATLSLLDELSGLGLHTVRSLKS